ncbi:hypothetical protein Taro_043915 [Colocasia esculenta]|uniref:Uncharacterized protein n=1 Tax=Colocasia esculenta TaxID=4460 RepID=A0A843X2F4_COLES|nr:hypothetical protein [Colocasia esculenta]
MNANNFFNSPVLSFGDETYYTDNLIRNSSFLRVSLDTSGVVQLSMWSEEMRIWSTLWTTTTHCERFTICGPFGTCAMDSFRACDCLREFRYSWFPNIAQGANRCVSETTLSCGSSDTFLRMLLVKLREMSMDMSLQGCMEKCTVAFASADVRDGGRGCITWSGALMDMRNISANSQEFYLRVPTSDTGDLNLRKATTLYT